MKNEELYERSIKVGERIFKLQKTIESCERHICGISNGNIEDLSECDLDEGQKQLIKQLLAGVLKSRMTEAEKELEQIIPREEDECDARMDK